MAWVVEGLVNLDDVVEKLAQSTTSFVHKAREIFKIQEEFDLKIAIHIGQISKQLMKDLKAHF